MEQSVITALQSIKRKYEPEGFVIIGVFGSFARGEEKPGSDLDILYELSPIAYEKYPGLRFVELYERIKNELHQRLQLDIDLADKSALSDIGRKYILPEVRYVA